MLITQAYLDRFLAEVGDLGRILVPSSSFFAAKPEQRRVLPCMWPCGHGRALQPLEVAARETAALLQSDWQERKFGTSQSLSGNLGLGFFNLCIYFWLLTKGSTVPSHRSVN